MRSWLQRLTGRPGDAVHAVGNLYADHDPATVPTARVLEVLSAHGAGGAAAQDLRRQLYREAIESFVRDQVLTEAERAYLERLRDSLGLAHDEALALVREGVGHVLQAEVAEMLADRRFSPAEEERLRASARALGVEPLTFGAAGDAQLAHLRALWHLEHGELPVEPAPVALQRGEVCHAVVAARWYEHRMRTVRVDYAGVATSVRLMKGVRLRMGSITPQRVTTTELTEVGAGTAIVTSKRIILAGAPRNKTLRLSGLLAITPYGDGVGLEPASGRPTIVSYEGVSPERAEYVTTLVSEVLARA